MHYIKHILNKKNDVKCKKFRCPHCNVFTDFDVVQCLQKELKYYKKRKWELKKRVFVSNVESILMEWLNDSEKEFWVKDSGFLKTENMFRNYKIDCKLMRDVVYCIVKKLHMQVKPVHGVRVWNNFGDDESCKHIYCRCSPSTTNGEHVEYNFSIVRMGIVEDGHVGGDSCRDGIIMNCTKRKCSARHM